MSSKGSYSSKDWGTFSSTRAYASASTTTEDIYKSRNLDKSLDPKEFKLRESVDSLDYPESTPVIIALDVTGSMDLVLDSIARKGLNTICQEIYTRKPVTDPHICVLGIGDVECDRAPFQATQFEVDIKIFEQLEKLYLEEGGGGNDYESYILAWYFAKYRTKCDSFAKRGRKGFIFTIGDEEVTRRLTSDALSQHMGDKDVKGFTPKELFDEVSKEWQIFHIILKQGSHASHSFKPVLKSWQDVVGHQHVIALDDYTKVGETIISIMEMMSGKDLADVAKTWDGTTAVVVESALKDIKGAVDKHRGKVIDAYL